LLQLFPCDFKLPHGTLVFESVQTDVLDQNVEAMNEAASGRVPVLSCCSGGGNKKLLKLSTAPA
jgi:hypothetical protein